MIDSPRPNVTPPPQKLKMGCNGRCCGTCAWGGNWQRIPGDMFMGECRFKIPALPDSFLQAYSCDRVMSIFAIDPEGGKDCLCWLQNKYRPEADAIHDGHWHKLRIVGTYSDDEIDPQEVKGQSNPC